MSDEAKSQGPLLLGALVVLAVLAVAIILMGMYPVGIALLAVAIALLPSAYKSAKGGKADDAGR